MDHLRTLRQTAKRDGSSRLAEGEAGDPRLLNAHSGDFEALLQVGFLRCQQGRYADALTLICAALKAKPDSVPALKNHAVVLGALGRPAEALASCDRALALAPDAQSFFIRGNFLVQLRRYEDALRSYDEAIALQPIYVEALHNRGTVLGKLRYPAEALASHEQALAIRPLDPSGIYNRANALFDLRRYDEALESYDRALAMQPGHREALHNRAVVLRMLGRLEQALTGHDRALRLDPDNPEGHLNRGLVLCELKRYEEALAACAKAIALRPNSASAFNHRGNILLELKRYAEALASYDDAVAIEPGCVEALHNRGTVLRVLRRPVEALASHDQALRIRPEDAEGCFNRGIVLFALDRHEEAVAAYDQALALGAARAEVFKHRGTALRMLKRREEAVTSYRQALERGGDPEEINYLLAGFGAELPPRSAPRKFIIELFDQYADDFERHLTKGLSYQAPALIADAIERRASAGNHDVIDLGCGTGLLGARLQPLARTLTGVDLSPNMLQKARQRQIYDQLICADVTEFLRAQTARYDIAVAGDLFIYIGDLSGVFEGIGKSLKSGGLFGFSIEVSKDEDFVLTPSLRYAQSVAYLQRLANDNGFIIQSMEPAAIRQEQKTDVNGYVVIMRTPT
jgi:predicted TPR repeat methyltransferase